MNVILMTCARNHIRASSVVKLGCYAHSSPALRCEAKVAFSHDGLSMSDFRKTAEDSGCALELNQLLDKG